MTIECAKQDTEEYPRGKLADATIKFENGDYGPLSGCALTGFGVWTPENDGDEPTVTLPARVYAVDGERRRFDLLTPADPDRSVEPLKAAPLGLVRQAAAVPRPLHPYLRVLAQPH